MQNEANILIVDDELGPRESLRMILKPTFNVQTVENGKEALRFIRQEPVNLVTLDLKMPGIPGIEVLKGIKGYNPNIEVIVLTGYGSLNTAVEALRYGALDYISKPFDVSQVEEAVKRGIEKYKTNMPIMLQKTMEQTVYAMALTVETKDPYTAGHQRRVVNLACAIAQEMDISREQTHGVRMAGIIHDIGKIYVPSEILNKPGQLTEIEHTLIKAHPQTGYNILKTIEFPWPIAQIVLQHHERMDGSGYPSGLTGEDIILEARILAVADVVEATASHRPYRPALGIDKALQEISQNRGSHYDPAIVDACLRLFNEKGFEFE